MSDHPCVLLVEDDQDVRETIAEILEEEGYRVAAVADGRMALDYLTQNESKPKLILLDLMMPNMDGFQFRELQMASAELAKIPTAVLSADGRVGDKAASLSAEAFLGKPVKLARLLSLVEEYCGPASRDRAAQSE